MHDDHQLIEQRLTRTLLRLRPAIYSATVGLSIEIASSRPEPIGVDQGLASAFSPASIGQSWGPAWGTTWMRFTGRVPPQWRGRVVEAIIDIGFEHADVAAGFQAEGLVHLPDGTPVKSLNPRTPWVPVTRSAQGGEAVEWFVEAASNPVIPFHLPQPTRQGDILTAGTEPLYRLRTAQLAVFEAEVWELVMDLDVLGELQAELDPTDARRRQILRAIDRALDQIDLHDIPGTAANAREQLKGALQAPARASAHRISAIGHSHIDSAWLWPIRETIRKVARTTANVTQLMENDPEFLFAMSSAQQFDWLKQNRPTLYARVADRVRTGQLIPVGGMWVESDTNMPGGEALARQFAFGKRFFLEEFGIDCPEVWLPDSFGYSAALPQLVRLAGARWFLTQKISWSDTNTFPHHSFAWEGIDGTRVFTHFPPIDTYNAELTGKELAHAARTFSEQASGTGSLAPFGYGDGGGGPTREMLARARRLKDLDGSPTVTVEPPAAFFARAEAEYPDAPVWLGELYLEYHRGVYTSQLRTKQGNRRSEHLLREAELWCATAGVRCGADYPYDTLDRIWKKVLLLQFHDILPGSSIAWVHREAVADHAECARELEELIARAQRTLAGEGDTPLLFNANPHPREGSPALGAAAGSAFAEPPAAEVRVSAGAYEMVTDHLRVRVDHRGLITSILDLDEDREVLAPDTVGNLLQLHRDTPNLWDAWDIDRFYRNTVTDLTEAESVEARPTAIHVVRRHGDSTIRQIISVPLAAKRIDIATEIDWQEEEHLLKAGFTVDVTADRSAAEIQFGHVFRPTHTNTTWDAAKFEICAHRWIHVGEPGYGVAIVNDSTYGHDVTRHPRPGGGSTTMVRLSLLRAPRNPDPLTDRGRHRLSYSIVPGADIADAIREGYRINLPRRVVPGAGAVEPLVASSHPGVLVESVKLAHDRSGDVVVRLYESLGRRCRARVRPAFEHDGVWPVDLLERDLDEVEHNHREVQHRHDGVERSPDGVERGPDGVERSHDGVTLDFGPFQIHTLRFRRGGAAAGSPQP